MTEGLIELTETFGQDALGIHAEEVALKRRNRLLQVGVDFEECREPYHFQHVQHLWLGVEQFDVLLHAAAAVAVYGVDGFPAFFLIRQCHTAEQKGGFV
jgi:hypothetical protein